MRQVFVHTRHPRIYLVGQQAFATLVDMLRPVVHAFLRGLEIRNVVITNPTDGVNDPIDGVLNASGNIAEHL